MFLCEQLPRRCAQAWSSSASVLQQSQAYLRKKLGCLGGKRSSVPWLPWLSLADTRSPESPPVLTSDKVGIETGRGRREKHEVTHKSRQLGARLDRLCQATLAQIKPPHLCCLCIRALLGRSAMFGLGPPIQSLHFPSLHHTAPGRGQVADSSRASLLAIFRKPIDEKDLDPQPSS